MAILLGAFLAVAAAIGLTLYIYGSGIAAPLAAVDLPPSSLVASPAAAFDRFSETGTVILDESQGSPAVPFLLYTTYDAEGKPSIRTKRLVFPGEPACQAAGLPCAAEGQAPPLAAGAQVRIEGTVTDEVVQVERFSVL